MPGLRPRCMLPRMRRTLAENGAFLLRVAVSLMMLSHGVPKALDYDTLVQTFPDPLNVGTEMSAMLILFAEVGCSILLLIGVFGRFASATLFIAMMVAAFAHHFERPVRRARALAALRRGLRRPHLHRPGFALDRRLAC